MTSFKTLIASISYVYQIMLTLLSMVAATNPRPCQVDGKTYRDGEQFSPNCSLLCTCQDGKYACSSKCPQELTTSVERPLQGFTPGLDPGSLLQGMGVSTFAQHGGAGRHTQTVSSVSIRTKLMCVGITTDVNSSEKWIDSGMTMGSTLLPKYLCNFGLEPGEGFNLWYSKE